VLIQLQKSVLNNPPYIVLMEGKNNGIKCVCVVFCTQPLATGAQEFGYSTYKIATSEDCFMFYYSEDYQLHFRIEGNELGSLEVAENHSFLSFKYREMDRITISLSATSTSFVDINLFDMKVTYLAHLSLSSFFLEYGSNPIFLCVFS
jgi:hypothetical protein